MEQYNNNNLQQQIKEVKQILIQQVKVTMI